MHTGPFLFPVKKVEMKNAAVYFNRCVMFRYELCQTYRRRNMRR